MQYDKQKYDMLSKLYAMEKVQYKTKEDNVLSIEKVRDCYGNKIAEDYGQLIDDLEDAYLHFLDITDELLITEQKYLFLEALRHLSSDYGLGDYIPFT